MHICGICGKTSENKGFYKDVYMICGECLDKIEEMRKNDPIFEEMMKMPVRSVDSQEV